MYTQGKCKKALVNEKKSLEFIIDKKKWLYKIPKTNASDKNGYLTNSLRKILIHKILIKYKDDYLPIYKYTKGSFIIID
jgi:hypothetical protein